MSNLAIVFGVLLGILGGVLFGLSESHSPTALIPAGFGIALILCGLIAKNEKARMHAMHFAALLGLLGFGFPIWRLIKKFTVTSDPPAQFNQLADGGQIAMAALCGVFLALCVKSFIDARRARKAREATGGQS
jgi:hypothetical protein